MSNTSNQVNGGAGAGLISLIKLENRGIHELSVGAGGTSKYGAGYNECTGGESSYLKKDNDIILNVGGGSGALTRSTSRWDAAPGVGGTITDNSFCIKTYLRNNGSNGNQTVNNTPAYAPDGPISGHTWGKAGDSFCYWSGGDVRASYHGYVKIVYMGQKNLYNFIINPIDPPDPFIDLSAPNCFSDGNSILVYKNANVNWSVRKNGYVAQSGSTIVNDDTTLNITLIKLPTLYYCYTYEYNSGRFYLYTQNLVTDVSTRDFYYANGSIGNIAQSSSDLNSTWNATPSALIENGFILNIMGAVPFYRTPSLDLYY